MRKRLWLNPYTMMGVQGNEATTGAAHVASCDDLTELVDEISDFGFPGVILTADGKYIGGYVPCPHDLDPKFEVGFQVHWTGDVTGSTAEVTWILLQNAVKRGVVLATPTAALDTVLVSDPNSDADGDAAATDYLYQVSDRGIRNSIGLSRPNIEEGALITLQLEQQSATAETAIILLGIMMDYMPMQTQGIGNNTIGPLSA